MRKNSPWAARFVAVALLASTTALPARAQFATMDIPHIGVQIVEFAKKANDWVKTVQNYAIVRDAFAAAQTANTIATNIKSVTDQVRTLTSDGLALQRSIQDGLKQVQNIRNLRVSNMTDLKNLALNLSTLNFSSFLPNLGQSQQLVQALADGTDASAITVKEALTVVSTKSGVRRTARDMREQQRMAVMGQLALENKAMQEKVTQAFQYKKTADEYTATAVELQATTNTTGAMVMTDGERVAVNARASDMLLKAQELREKASALMLAATEKGPTQIAAEKAMNDELQVAGLVAMHQAMHPDEVSAY